MRPFIAYIVLPILLTDHGGDANFTFLPVTVTHLIRSSSPEHLVIESLSLLNMHTGICAGIFRTSSLSKSQF